MWLCVERGLKSSPFWVFERTQSRLSETDSRDSSGNAPSTTSPLPPPPFPPNSHSDIPHKHTLYSQVTLGTVIQPPKGHNLSSHDITLPFAINEDSRTRRATLLFFFVLPFPIFADIRLVRFYLIPSYFPGSIEWNWKTMWYKCIIMEVFQIRVIWGYFMKAFINSRVECWGITERDHIGWHWVAPTCMNVVKLNICFPFYLFEVISFLHIQLSFIHLFIFIWSQFRFWYKDYELLHNRFSIMNGLTKL